MSQVFPAMFGLFLSLGMMGAGQAVVRRVIEGKWREGRKPDSFQYALLMRDLTISDILHDYREDRDRKKPLTGNTRVRLEKEYEEELDNLILEVCASQLKNNE